MVLERAYVDHIPVAWVAPTVSTTRRHLAIWQTGLGGSIDSVERHLHDLAALGFYALSFDPVDHGLRRRGTEAEFRQRMGANKRRYFWPIMTLTAEEYPRVVDFAVERFGIDGAIVAGGISMGGDIAVCAAGLDERIGAVVAGISTPDWLRPGSNEGESHPDRYAWQGYHRRNPITNLQLYQHCPAILFVNGAADPHVPPEAARRFQTLLRQEVYRDCPESIEIQEFSAEHAFTDEMWQASLAWFKKHRENRGA